MKLIKIAPLFMLIAALGISSSSAQFGDRTSASSLAPVTSLGPATRLASTAEPQWLWPLAPPHQLVGGYVAPLTAYSAGHRGIDIATAAADPVFAPHNGVVSFAGTVVDRGVLSLAIDGDYLASVEPVIPLVAVGESVVSGQVIAEVAAGGHCEAGCLHFGVRLHGRYVSPLVVLGKVPRAVLLPLDW
ncbi:murein hydrolase activator EnvC family protein [Leifsonia sp. A12D58]|uniref:murein hydrolase activator EnvC family protein n=1 Tax=Leifsonia sp. A12D58 TaxID=3397674 RepID=UPI0039E00B4B